MNLQTLNLQNFVQGDSSERQAFVSSLGSAFESIGFAAIEGHGFSNSERDALQGVIKDFFEQATEEKMRSHNPKAKGQRGYTPFGIEHAKGESRPDLKEFYQWGPMNATERSLAPNIQVPHVDNLDSTVKSAYEKLEMVGQNLMRAIALHLNLPENFFDAYLDQGHSIFRAIHYPGQTSPMVEGIRAAAHEDINLITLLMGASAEGLELLNKEDQWVPIHVTSEVLVINVGDMLQRLTNNLLRSTTHRVVNPSADKCHLPRFSMPFFVHPAEEMPLNCLDFCVSPDHPKSYEDMTAGAYLHERLVEIGLA
ncbi:MAG: 2-oxoglutarate and iron-dependent oxygenase domain-containing protein [Schleiferiaceae bacterium]|nr:2-oxoglutarate and iron-dependent oxygenase domain-containing protein [Schleiferiaceae bacterium]